MVSSYRWVLLAFVVLGLTGCTKAAPIRPTSFYAYGTDGWFTSGYAYDGQGVAAFNGVVALFANDEANEGTFLVRGFTSEGDEWWINFTSFRGDPAKPFQDGGIASDFHEHGATGVADTSIPEVDVAVAAWGEATILRNGNATADPLTDEPTWLAHFMVIRTGVRDDRTHAIYKADGTTPYDPSQPQDGLSNATDAELHLVLKSHGTPPTNVTRPDRVEASVDPPLAYSDRHEVFTTTSPGSMARLWLNVTGTPSLQLANLSFVFRDPGGRELARERVGGTASPTHSAEKSFRLDTPGSYVVDVEGRGPGVTYTVESALQPPAAVVLNFWWETVSSGAEAERALASLASPSPTTTSPSP